MRSIRAGATRALIAAAALAVVVPACAASHYQQVSCKGVNRQSIFILEAQAVPSATFVPCILPLPVGWSYGGSEVGAGLVRFWLNSDRGGVHAVEVALTRTCDVSGANQIPLPSGEISLQEFEEPATRHPDATVRHYVFIGGCVTTRFSFTRQTAPLIFDQADRFLGFTPRSVYVNGVRDDEGLTLCGAGAPSCPG